MKRIAAREALREIPAGARQSTVLSMRRLLIAGIVVCVALIGGFGGWAASAKLAGAVIAPATVVVESEFKKIQHATGGIVGELLVRNGAEVKAGDVLIRLDETVTRANLAVVAKTLDELAGRRARLEAERDGSEAIAFPEDLLARGDDAEVRRIVSGERRLFGARRTALAGQKAQLRERVAQLRTETDGLRAQLDSTSRQIALIADELKGVEDLFEKNLVPITRLKTLQRDATQLQGGRGEIVAAIAQANGKIAETELQSIQLDQDLNTEVLEELREIEGQAGELIERKVAAEDELRRVAIRSPQDGVVHELAVHTVGGVIGAGETLMFIVPENDALAIEARVAPQDIDQVVLGQGVVVRLSAFNQRTTPELLGTTTRISAGITEDPEKGLAYYTARIELSQKELRRLHGLKLVPGMPAEVHIRTGERTPLGYLVRPLTDQFAKAFREE